MSNPDPRSPRKYSLTLPSADALGFPLPQAGEGIHLPALPARQRPVPDVAPEKRALEADLPRGGIGTVAGLREVVAERAGGEHATAGGDHVAACIELRPGMEHLDVAIAHHGLGVEARNDIAGPDLARIAAGRDHDTQ